MKIKQLISLSLLATVCCTSCLDLDYNEVTTNDENWVYESPIYGVQKLVTNVYAHVQNEFDTNYSGAIKASTTDEADYASSLSDIHKFYNGGWSPINPFSTIWKNAYSAIAEANIFLEKYEKISLEDYLYNASGDTDYELLKSKFEMFPYEVRYLRAYFYFELAKAYGNVPLVTKSLTNTEANNVQQTPVNDVFKYICDECDQIAEFLPITYKNELSQDIGRASRPMALALKARTQLYAASPLFNPSGDKGLWKKAAESNKLVIDKCTEWGISLDKYSSLWGTENFFNKEMIMIMGTTDAKDKDGRAERNDFEKFNYPVGVENGNSGNCPTQNLVDAYEYKETGKTFGETWGNTINLNVDKPYDGLDPRFAMTIIKHGDAWPSYNTFPIEITHGGLNAPPLYGATPTGYYLKKYCDGSVNISTNNANYKRHSWILFRLGEFYLNYAEAVYQYSGNADDKSEFGMSANEALNVLRDRVDVQMPHITGSANWETRYIRERMVELAFEDHRFWDIRRWKKGNEYFTNIKTMRLDKKEDGTVIMTRGSKTRQWNDKYYLFPIPFTEIQKNPKLKQNPGWE